MIRCIVRAGATTYTGIYPSTSAAVLDALDRFPLGTPISARRSHA